MGRSISHGKADVGRGIAGGVLKRGFLLLVAVLLGCCSSSCWAAGSPQEGAQLSPSVMLIGKFDWQQDASSTPGAPWSRCLHMVWQSKRAGSNHLNFVPTHHWLPPTGNAASSSDNGVGSYCLMTGTNGRNTCIPWTQQLVDEFRSAMTLCFTEALRQGYTLYVRPHLDDGTGHGAWRNGLLFRPAEKYGGFSYYDIMLAPLADALRDAYQQAAKEQVLSPGTTLYFSMQGEMSATIMRFANDWGNLVGDLRGRVTGGDRLVTVKIGVGMNFNRLNDVSSINQQFGSSRLSWLFWSMNPGGGAANAPQIDGAALQRLFYTQLDFVGISAYAPLSGPGMQLQELENSAFQFGDDMQNYGVDIQKLVNSGKLELQYSEFGLGGGSSYAGQDRAASPGDVALRPFFGVYGTYTSAEDPWNVPANKAFLREYYSKAVRWLADPSNKSYKVSAAFIWSMNSWDVLGIYPESTSAQGSYQDPDIVGMIAQHNLRMQGISGDAEVAYSNTRGANNSGKPSSSSSTKPSSSSGSSDGAAAELVRPGK